MGTGLVRALLLAALAAALLAVPAAADMPYENGDRVRFTGLVTSPDGQPIADLHVVLEASRSRFDLLRFRRTKKDVTRLTDLSNQKGEYDLEWPWNDYYNHFELVVGIPVYRDGEERLKELERVEVTRRLERGSPVVSAVVVEEADYVRNLRQFLATLTSEEERDVYRQMGPPDRVERIQVGARNEVSWWYFESGKVYRFQDGQLTRIEPFDPIQGF